MCWCCSDLMAEQATPPQGCQAGLWSGTQQPDRACAARIAQAVQAAYTALPKTGKPQPNEHTVLAGIVAYTAAPTHSSHQAQQQQPLRVIALGTGSKCLGASKRSPIGDVLNDSHAEVIARRAFVAWALQQLQLAVQSAQQQQHPQHSMAQQEQQQEQQQQPTPANSTAPSVQDSQHGSQQSAFTWCPDTRRFALRPGLHFALYISQPPCGDASIFTTPGQAQAGCWEDQGPGDAVPAAAAAGAAGEPAQQQKQKQEQAVGRTGAKVLRPLGAADVAEAAAAAAAAAAAGAQVTPQQHVGVGSSQPTHAAAKQQQQVCSVPTARDVEAGPQQLAVLRRKPGKGDPTLSLSCSDKIARWACLGLQGCLLSSLLQEPLYLSMLVVSVPGTGTGASLGAAAAAGGGAEGTPPPPLQQQQQQKQHQTQQPDQQQQQEASDAANAGETGQQHQHPSNQLQQEQEQQPQYGQAGTQQAVPAVLAAAEAAGKRAVGERVMACARVLQPPYRAMPPAVVAVEAAPAGLGLQPGGARDVPSGTSVNWSCQLPLLSALTQQRAGSKQCAGGVHEATSAAFGRKHGTARKGPAATSVKTRSRLCSATLFGQWQKLLESLPQQESAAAAAAGATPSDQAEPLEQEPGAEGEQRAQAKRGAGAAYQHMWSRLRATPTFAGWLAK